MTKIAKQIAALLMLLGVTASAQVVFQDDFSAPTLDSTKWNVVGNNDEATFSIVGGTLQFESTAGPDVGWTNRWLLSNKSAFPKANAQSQPLNLTFDVSANSAVSFFMGFAAGPDGSNFLKDNLRYVFHDQVPATFGMLTEAWTSWGSDPGLEHPGFTIIDTTRTLRITLKPSSSGAIFQAKNLNSGAWDVLYDSLNKGDASGDPFYFGATFYGGAGKRVNIDNVTLEYATYTGPTPTPTPLPPTPPGGGAYMYYDDYDHAAGIMPNHQPLVVPPTVVWETWPTSAGGGDVTWDGDSRVKMRLGSNPYTTYMDTRSGTITTNNSHDYAFVTICRMNASGGAELGFCPNAGPLVGFKLFGGNIYFGNRTDSNTDVTSDLQVGTYTVGQEFGLMFGINKANNNIKIYKQNGTNKDTTSASWVDITPSSDPNGVLNYAYRTETMGIFTIAPSSAPSDTFDVNSVAVIEDPGWPGVTPTPSAVSLWYLWN